MRLYALRSSAPLYVAVTLAMVGLARRCDAQFPASLDVTRYSESDGASSFKLEFFPYGPYFGTSVHLPDGSVIDLGVSSLRSKTFDSFEDLESAFIGEWSIEKIVGSSPNPETEVYNFEITGLPEELLLGAPPQIDSPIHGSTVGEQFAVSWTRATSGTPTAEAFSITMFSADGRSTRGKTMPIDGGEPPSLQLDLLELNDEVTGEVEMRVGDFKLGLLDGFMSEITTDSPNPSWNRFLTSRFTNYSTPIRVSVGQVPEPGSLALLFAGLAIAIGVHPTRPHRSRR